MHFIYSISVFLYVLFIRIAAITGNSKARLWVEGRRNWRSRLRTSLSGKNKNRIWIHCASLGEFEQGRPLIEGIKKLYPETAIVLTFFSPSGYEVRKDYNGADVICYLPEDNRSNAAEFLEIVSPRTVLFIKYEYWLNYFEECRRRNIPLYMASAIFRNDQVFFRSWGKSFRKVLRCVTTFFVQNKNSAELLASAGFNNVLITGDTRFDRVKEIAGSRKPIGLIEKFKADRKLIIAGSSWEADEELLVRTLTMVQNDNAAVLIAPHEVNEKRIAEITATIRKYFPAEAVSRFTSWESGLPCKFMILDTIGLLSSAYAYGNIAWIGGGFGKGIHNILEAAVFGNPVLFGGNYQKFDEAKQLVSINGAFSVDAGNGAGILNRLLNDESFYAGCSKKAAEFVGAHTGATEKIISLLENQLRLQD